jgi:hypothetical protein
MSTAPPLELPRRRLAPVSDSADVDAHAIELRLLATHEARLVRRLAVLDEAPELRGQVLVALIGGQAVAALSLADHRVVANPFVPTAAAVALLRLRAAQLTPERARTRRLARLTRAGWRGSLSPRSRSS